MDRVEQVFLGAFGKPPTDRSALYLLQKLLEVGLELLAALHASVAQQAPAQQSLALARDLLPEVLLREFDFLLRVDAGDFGEGLAGRVGVALHSEEEVEDALGVVVGFLEEAPHALREMYGGVVFGVVLVDRDARLEGGHQVLLEVVEDRFGRPRTTGVLLV